METQIQVCCRTGQDGKGAAYGIGTWELVLLKEARRDEYELA
jgi:hypothetical protein